MTGEMPQPREPASMDLMAHDVRAALADIVGGVRLLDDGKLAPGAVRQVERVRAAAELLSRLVEEMMDGGLDRPPDDRPPAAVDLRRVLDDVMARWRGAADPLGVTIGLRVADDVPRVVQTRHLGLRRIVDNVLSNALRHARGRIDIDVRAPTADRIVLTIRDDGPGFPPDILPNLFGSGTRGAGSTGSGLGLHIAAGHSREIGGTLTARNDPDGGAIVTLELGDLHILRPSEEDVGVDLTGMRVLVADDSDTVRTVFVGMLEQMGAACETAADGVVALNWLARERFDLALIDIEMPMLSGREVIRAERLRQAKGVAPPLPMIATTAHISRQVRDAILEEGADGVIDKPVPDRRTFGRILDSILRELPAVPHWQPEASAPLSPIMLAELLQAAGPVHAEEVLIRLTQDLRDAEAELTTALNGGDKPATRFQTHILLSLAGAVGGVPTQTAARALNAAAHDGGTGDLDALGTQCLNALGRLRAELAVVTDGMTPH
ncbi:hybrid sensor histidine kinase/response regulator [Jannaschia sp. LMIT008]|uniref:hybrid sensor histidine kinase/response regulator n=1 Tax=Jannaschia maritima TaxID=3032585 RepID=UPI002810E6A7|nr:hybrid sensor histidine kinase/response regulator [Jannaschia sp. LMIT008]